MDSPNSIKSLMKAIAVLNSFSLDEVELSLAEIAQKVKIPKPTAYRILSTLAHGGLVEKKKDTGTYRIGPSLYTLGNLYLYTTDLIKAAEPVTKTLNDLTGDAVHVGIFEKGYVTTVMKQETKLPFRWSSYIGRTLPAYASAMGKALLSELSEDEIDALYSSETLKPVTKKTISTKTKLKNELSKIRETGVAIIKEDATEGIESIGCVIRDARGTAVAATSFSAPVFTMNQARRKLLAKLIKMGASLISYRLGYQGINNPVRDIKEISSWWEQNQPHSTTETSE